jgi:hypothetical protein
MNQEREGDQPDEQVVIPETMEEKIQRVALERLAEGRSIKTQTGDQVNFIVLSSPKPEGTTHAALYSQMDQETGDLTYLKICLIATNFTRKKLTSGMFESIQAPIGHATNVYLDTETNPTAIDWWMDTGGMTFLPLGKRVSAEKLEVESGLMEIIRKGFVNNTLMEAAEHRLIPPPDIDPGFPV